MSSGGQSGASDNGPVLLGLIGVLAFAFLISGCLSFLIDPPSFRKTKMEMIREREEEARQLAAEEDDDDTSYEYRSSSADNSVMAMVNIKARIEQEWPTPSTIDHPILNVVITRTGSGYRVTSHFDSENVFGGTVRTRYQATTDAEGNVLSIIYQ